MTTAQRLTLDQLVWSDRDRLSGEPCFRDTRVPVRALFDYLSEGESLETFLEHFEGVSREQAQGVLELARRGLFDRNPAA